MRLKLLFVIMLLAVGCRGKNGSTGPQGTPGLNGPQEVTLSGAIISNDFIVTDTRIKLASNVSVFLNDGITLTESPYFLPVPGINTFYLLDPAAGTVHFYNAQTASATGYIIVLLI